MKKIFFIILTLLSFATSAQDVNFRKATLRFYPSFELSSTLIIDFKNSEVFFILDKAKQTKRINISPEENKELKSLIIDLLKNDYPPIDTLATEDGKTYLIDGRLSEDGMTTYIYLNNKKEPAIQLGNSYSKQEAELLDKTIYLIRNRVSNDDYFDTIKSYLN
jgi:hypothetical protein